MIVLTAFEAIPGAGTEAGLAWNWGQAYIEAGFEVTVLTSAGATAQDHAESWRRAGIAVVFLGGPVDPRAPQSPTELLSVARHIDNWITACRKWLDEHSSQITFVQHVSWGSVRLRPPFLRVRQPLTSVWGPLGGGQLAKFSGLLPKSRIHELVRAASFPIGWIMRRIDFLMHRTPTLSLATNVATLNFMNSVGVSAARTMLADGIQPDRIIDKAPKSLEETIKLVWLGRMVASKRADIAIELLAAICARGIPACLTMIGDGPQRQSLEKRAQKLGVSESVEFVGRVEWEETFKFYDRSDFLIFTSMRDSSCPAVLEAAARGVPTLCLRHQGVEAMVPPSVAAGPAKFKSATLLAEQLSDLVAGFREEPVLYTVASRDAIEFAKTQTWARKVDLVLDYVDLKARP